MLKFFTSDNISIIVITALFFPDGWAWLVLAFGILLLAFIAAFELFIQENS